MPIQDEYGELTYYIDSEHMVCSKCGIKSNTEIENKIHHHRQHKTNYIIKSRWKVI